MEVYEQQKPFKLETLKSIAQFCNNFVFKTIWDNLIGEKTFQLKTFLTPLNFILTNFRR